jgi:D-methionine transport system substrate-binding protein
MKIRKLAVIVLALAMILTLGACKKKNETLKIGASPTPHAEILAIAKEILAEEGITLEIVEFTDYVQPNLATEDGDIDANYFQHFLYLLGTDDTPGFNEENGTHLVSAGAIHYEPFGIYPGTTAAIADLQDGAKIAVPNDTTNEARALLLLEAQGLITLKAGVGLGATKFDITDNPLNLEIVEVEAAQITNVLGDVDLAVINGNYAMAAGLSVGRDAVAIEDSGSTAIKDYYANIIAVKEGNENNDAVKALVKALQSDKVREYINSTYDGAVVPMF